MPYYGRGHLLTHNNCTSPEVLGLYILMEIESLHKRGYIHRDIKPENIMLKKVDGHLTAVPVDFDLMIKIPEGQERILMNSDEKIYYTPGFDAPEIHLKREYSFATDIYALGKTLEILGCNKDIYEKMVRPYPITRRTISIAMEKIVEQFQRQHKTSDIARVLQVYKIFCINHAQKNDPLMKSRASSSVDLLRPKEIVFSNGVKNQLPVIKEDDEILASSHRDNIRPS